MLSGKTTVRSGYGAVLVLLVIALVSGLSIAMLRSLRTMHAQMRNLNLQAEAQTAAMSGLEHALMRMGQADWEGPNSNYSLALDSTIGFDVAYAYNTSLSEADEDYWQQPYRVDVAVTGYAVFDGRKIQYQVIADALLTDVQLNSISDFALNLPSETVSVTSDSQDLARQSHLGFWNQINGSTYSHAGIRIWDTVEESYRVDFLNEMTSNLWEGYAPLTGRCDVVSNVIDGSFADAVAILVLDLFQVSQATGGSKYSAVGESYQIYRGGPVYQIPTLTGNYQAEVWENSPDNPWGLFRGTSQLTFKKDCQLSGCLAMDTGALLTLVDQGIALESPLQQLPDGNRFQLPVLLADQLEVQANKSITIDGLVVVDQQFRSTPAGKSAALVVNGQVYCDQLLLETFEPDKNNTVEIQPSSLSDYVKECDLPTTLYGEINGAPINNPHWQTTSEPFLIPRSSPNDGYRWSVLSIEQKGLL